MAKQLDKDMMRMMSITERFNYIAAKKKMMMEMGEEWPKPLDEVNHNIDTNNTTCSYSGLPSMEVYKDEPGASLKEQAKHTNWDDEWVDRDESDYDSSSDGYSKRGGNSSGDDSNEY
tara:strand:- start:430 stop:780 length:351 start_codon:yes stop_codon:yes gene_type:complete